MGRNQGFQKGSSSAEENPSQILVTVSPGSEYATKAPSPIAIPASYPLVSSPPSYSDYLESPYREPPFGGPNHYQSTSYNHSHTSTYFGEELTDGQEYIPSPPISYIPNTGNVSQSWFTEPRPYIPSPPISNIPNTWNVFHSTQPYHYQSTPYKHSHKSTYFGEELTDGRVAQENQRVYNSSHHISNIPNTGNFTGVPQPEQKKKSRRGHPRLESPIGFENMETETVMRLASAIRIAPETDKERKFAICYIAAEQAAAHILQKRKAIDAAFTMFNIQSSDYAVYAGFDESLVQKGIAYLQQIHIFTIVDRDATEWKRILYALGQVLSPFSSIIYTPFCSPLHVPVFKKDETIVDFNELVSETSCKIIDRNASDLSTPIVYPTVICSYQEFYQSWAPTDDSGAPSKSSADTSSFRTSDTNASQPNPTKKGGSRGDKNNDENDDLTPGKGSEGASSVSDPPNQLLKNIPTISFKVEADVISTGSLFQRLKTEGSFTIETTGGTGEKKTTCKIAFTKLISDGAKTTVAGYEQNNLRVTIDSRKSNSTINDIKPQQTLARAREEMFTSSSKVTKNYGASVSVPLHGIASLGGSMTRANEQAESSGRQQYTSRIHQHEFKGVVWWVFEIDDPYEREDGAKIQDEKRLPAAQIVYRARRSTNTTAPPTEKIDVEVSSSWSCIPSTHYDKSSVDWVRMVERIKKLINRAHTANAIQFSNVSQIITMAVPSDLSEDLHYHAELVVDAASAMVTSIQNEDKEGLGEFNTHISGTFTNKHNDLETNSKLELPSFRKLALSPCLRETTQTVDEKSGIKTKVFQKKPNIINTNSVKHLPSTNRETMHAASNVAKGKMRAT